VHKTISSGAQACDNCTLKLDEEKSKCGGLAQEFKNFCNQRTMYESNKDSNKPSINQHLPAHSLSHIVNSIQKITKTNNILNLHTTY
jgi:hypothetical protein